MSGTVVVVGAAGFLGTHLCAGFHGAGWRVFAARRPASSTWRLDRLAPEVARIALDLDSDTASLAGVLARLRPDVIFNAAAYGVDYGDRDEARAVDVNITGAGRLVDAAALAGVASLVHIGTAYEYGDQPGRIAEDAPLRPIGLYGTTKANGSRHVLERGAATGLTVSILRPFTLYGPTEGRHKFTGLVAGACRSGQPVDLTPGEQLRDWLHVDDVAAACRRLAEAKPVAGQVFNLGSGEAMTLRDFGRTVAAVVGCGDTCLRWGMRPYRPDEVMSLVSDASRFRSRFGWTPRIGLEEGLRRMLADEGEGILS